MAICSISGINSIEYMNEDAQGGFDNAFPIDLNYDKLTNYGMPSNWCEETNGYGFVLFLSGSKNQLPEHFRIIFPEGEKRIIIITGSGSEKVDISYSSITEINNVAFVKFTASEVGRKNDDTITMVTHIGNLK